MAHSPEHDQLAEILGEQILQRLRNEGFEGTINETELSFKSDTDDLGDLDRIQVQYQVNGRARVMAILLVEDINPNLVVLDKDAQKAIQDIKIARSNELSTPWSS